MSITYVDTSCVVAIGLAEPGYKLIAKRLHSADHVFSHHLLEAELLATACRENIPPSLFSGLLSGLRFIFPDQSLAAELAIIFSYGYIRGADALHLASALWLAKGKNDQLRFLSLDQQQTTIAKELGFSGVEEL